MAIGRNRSDRMGGAPADAFLKKGLTLDEVREEIAAASDGETPTTAIAGVPQAVLFPDPPGYAFATRVGPDGKIYATVAFTSIASTLRRFWFTHKLVRTDGTYGELRRQAVQVTAAMIAANRCEVEIAHGWRPNRTVHLCLVEAKHSVAITDDGGSRDQLPAAATYVDLPAPSGSQPPLATFSTGAGIVSAQVDNELYNSKFKYECLIYTRPNGTVDNPTGTAPASALAMWRLPVIGAQLGGDNGRFITPVVANQTYWDISSSNSPTLHFGGLTADQDACCRSQQKPWDAGEPFIVAAAFRLNGVWSVTDEFAALECYLEDSVAGRIATTRINNIGGKATRFSWLPLQFEETTVLATYVPSGSSKQWVRFGLRSGFTLSGGRTLMMYKAQAGNMQGAWKPHPNDRGQDGNPTAIPPTSVGGRATVGVGTSGSETPSGSGGQVIRGNVN